MVALLSGILLFWSFVISLFCEGQNIVVSLLIIK